MKQILLTFVVTLFVTTFAQAQTFQQIWIIGMTKDQIQAKYKHALFEKMEGFEEEVCQIKFTDREENNIFLFGSFDKENICNYQMLSYPTSYAVAIVTSLENDQNYVKIDKGKYLKVLNGVPILVVVEGKSTHFNVYTAYGSFLMND